MICSLFLALCIVIIDARHFNGGTIRWMPTNPYDNSSSITITIIQSYAWSYPVITCANNVPVSTSGRSAERTNLTCIVDCSTDGGYSAKPVDILTDCISTSSSIGMMLSERSVNITLSAGAHFYLAYRGSAWVALNSPGQGGLQWSIVSFIDLRMRPDGFINTPPVASVVSPQYVIVNRTAQIRIHTSDVNNGDHIRCRWSKYIPGYRRRKHLDENQYVSDNEKNQKQEGREFRHDEEVYRRGKRGVRRCSIDNCTVGCEADCECKCSGCIGTTCTALRCRTASGCPILSTTIDTPGSLMSTSSYPARQAIDECGGICYPGSVPNGTTLSGCTLSFRGLVPNTWYGIAIQVSVYVISIHPLIFFFLV